MRGHDRQAKAGDGERLATKHVFQNERDMQAAIRRELSMFEPGLVEADGGRERVVASGKIDITARDANGHFVVIELKAGNCPAGALAQVLAYSSDLERETGTPCRSVLVASQFSQRLCTAADRTQSLMLFTYEIGHTPT
jgi:RecB family endonuclease NucS